MDAVEFLREINRMCEKYESCNDCPLGLESCEALERQNPKKLVAMVEKWSKEHIGKTRQRIFLEEYPRVKMYDNVIDICPKTIEGGKCYNSTIDDCYECKKKYWETEV